MKKIAIVRHKITLSLINIQLFDNFLNMSIERVKILLNLNLFVCEYSIHVQKTKANLILGGNLSQRKFPSYWFSDNLFFWYFVTPFRLPSKTFKPDCCGKIFDCNAFEFCKVTTLDTFNDTKVIPLKIQLDAINAVLIDLNHGAWSKQCVFLVEFLLNVLLLLNSNKDRPHLTCVKLGSNKQHGAIHMYSLYQCSLDITVYVSPTLT